MERGGGHPGRGTAAKISEPPQGRRAGNQSDVSNSRPGASHSSAFGDADLRPAKAFIHTFKMKPNLLAKCVAEFIGTFTLIFIGVGAIHNAGNAAVGMGLLGVALAHGLAIAVMVSATGGISGGHLNPAVTLGLLVGGIIDIKNSIAYWISQLAGGVAAGLLLLSVYGANGVDVVRAGTPNLAEGVTMGTGILVELVLTFFLVFVVYGTAVDARAPKIGGLAIGLTIALDILFGGPITGGSMNPARTFGPAVAANFWKDHAVYWIGPMAGGALAGVIYGRFLIKEPK
jgi:MIP family channel proteins